LNPLADPSITRLLKVLAGGKEWREVMIGRGEGMEGMTGYKRREVRG
jgi:hypothetical protein